jgi:hypothetical protein
MLSDEEYLSNDDSLSLRLQRDSEIRFGPAYYKATIYDRSGKSVFDFGARRFFSCAVYGRDSSKAVSPWSPTSLCVALPELLNTRPGPGIKIARMSIFDVARQLTVAAWDFESLVTHKMWSVDGKFYLFRDVYGIYIFSTGGQNLISISESRSPHCFVLEGRFVCVIEKSGDVSVLDGSSGTLLVKEHFSKDGYTVRRARFDEQQNRVLVLVTHQDGSDAGRLCYSIRLRATN